ncbi:twin-arginine translocation pathway signal [Bradyrhizobium sp. CSS354]|uniref:twin-arginine translocation pathway signal n=1 Tax=Bradyrhizobium sp. CSS354 TaxID=2699172 RepID=UPI0023AFA969|nr:twin-arginine translocation pathway signal [Bradyrhizobium sp. CSS354]MDE5462100.1 twin-arginine translocation pathway signal [Bradyrhizobium sp. CSS354]
MAALIQYRLRACCVAVALLVAGFVLSGCAGMSETVAPAFADPARYELYDCKQLEGERKSLANRTGDLQRLMDKAQTGAGGAVVSELAYRNEYIAVRGQAQMADDAWSRNKCRETPPEATPAAAPAANPGPIKPGPKSTRAVR